MSILYVAFGVKDPVCGFSLFTRKPPDGTKMPFSWSRKNSFVCIKRRVQMIVARLVAVDYEVFGRVQGVFFRKFTNEKAESLGLRGWVKNTRQGKLIPLYRFSIGKKRHPKLLEQRLEGYEQQE